MKLRTYLDEKQISAADFAAALVARGFAVSEFGVRKWITGERIPRREAMMAIAEETLSQVTASDFYADANFKSDTAAE